METVYRIQNLQPFSICFDCILVIYFKLYHSFFNFATLIVNKFRKIPKVASFVIAFEQRLSLASRFDRIFPAAFILTDTSKGFVSVLIFENFRQLTERQLQIYTQNQARQKSGDLMDQVLELFHRRRLYRRHLYRILIVLCKRSQHKTSFKKFKRFKVFVNSHSINYTVEYFRCYTSFL